MDESSETMGVLGREYAEKDEELAKLIAQTARLKKRLTEIESAVTARMNAMEVTTLAAGGVEFKLKKDEKPIFIDNGWPAFIEWVMTTKAFEFLTRKVNSRAFKEHMRTTGGCPPGIDVYIRQKLSVKRKEEEA